MSSEFGYIPESPAQSPFNNKGIFTPTDIYNLDSLDKWTPQLGQLELIETVNASGVSSFDFSDLGDYNVHFLTVNNGENNTTGKGIAFRLYENNVLESGSVYKTARQFCDTNGTFTQNRSITNSAIRFSGNTDIPSIPRSNINGYIYFYNLLDSTKYSFTTQHSTGYSNSDRGEFIFGGNVLPQASYVNKIQVMAFDVGTFTADVSLYGIKEYS